MTPRFPLLLLAGLALGATASTPAQIDQPAPDDIVLGADLATVPADLDAVLAPMLEEIAKYQAQYQGTAEGYAQVLPLFKDAPADGVAALPDELSKQPDDGVSGAELWSATKLEAAPANIRVDVYDGPQGQGYVVVLQAKFFDALWQREINYGPETYRTTDWAPADEDVSK